MLRNGLSIELWMDSTAYEEVKIVVPYELKDSYKKKYQMETNCEILDNEA